MAQRATGFSRKTAAAKASHVDDPMGAMAKAPAKPRAIPLKLAPLLVPYKGTGRLSLRVERLPHLARLSGGRNNGDRSWSLASDELEDLTYLPPEGMVGSHMLAVRIIGLDAGAGTTLAVLDFPVSLDADAPATLCQEQPVRSSAEALDNNTQILRLRDELKKTNETLAACESELATMRQKAEQVETEFFREKLEAELTRARAAWNIELDQAVAAAAAQAASELAQSRDDWRAEQNARFAKSEERAQQHVAEARERWEQESQEILSVAKKAWRADEAARFAAAEAQLREQFATRLAEVTARCERAESSLAKERAQADAASASNGDEGEFHFLREELAEAKAALADRESMPAQMRLAAERARASWQRDSETALAKAQADWKANEAARLAAAKENWRKQSASALAELTVRLEEAEATSAQWRTQVTTARDRSNDAEYRRLRDDVAILQATLANRENELAAVRAVRATREQRAPEAKIVLRTDRSWSAVETPNTQRSAQATHHLFRDAVVAAILVAVAILFYPNIEALIPEDWWANIAAMTNAIGTTTGEPRAPAQSPLPVSPHATEQDTAVVVHAVNVRAGPSAGAAVISTLQRGLGVAVVEQRGNWTLIRIDGKSGTNEPQQGWAYSSFLKNAEGGDKRPSPTRHR